MSVRDSHVQEGKHSFIPKHQKLSEVLADHELAALGDAYVNLIYSLALSERQHKPVGKKAESSMLASALKNVGLRALLPSRMDRHRQADAAEALIVYSWLTEAVSLEEAVYVMRKGETVDEAFILLLQTILEKLALEKT
jgi:hypothetical protein